MELPALATGFAVLLALANGGNDHLKGLATLPGSGVAIYRQALWVASAATAAGSIASIFLAGAWVVAFGGRGLVPDEIARAPQFLTAVSAAAAITVGLATRIGLPISTTHALVGALAGTGFALAPGALDGGVLGQSFLLPLLLSPLIALSITVAIAPLLRRVGERAEAAPAACVCHHPRESTSGAVAFAAEPLAIHLGRVDDAACTPDAQLAVLPARGALDALHHASAAALSFARGLNDTAKMAAILIAGRASGLPAATVVAIAMTAGGLLAARRVARTMAQRITPIGAGDGVAANLVTAALVIGASRLGLPVSNTQVCCGAPFGLAAAGGRGRWSMIAAILVAWLTTLPLAASPGWLFASALPV